MGNFTQVPNKILLETKISDGAFRTYLVLKSFKYGKGKVFPSQQTVAKLRGLGRRTILNHLKELKKAGLIASKKRGYSTSNIYFFIGEENFTKEKLNGEIKFTTIEKLPSHLLRRKVPPNNTEDNNIKNNNIGIGILRQKMMALRLTRV